MAKFWEAMNESFVTRAEFPFSKYTYSLIYAHIGSWKKNVLRKTRVSGTVLMFQPMQNSPPACT